MNTGAILLTAVGLSMDAFAISLSSGMALKNCTLSKALKFGLFFGFFQFAMPILGFLLAFNFSSYIEAFDHWLAFALLTFIGAKMIYETFKENDEQPDQDSIAKTKNLLILSVATSIDAMASGISFAFLDVEILPAAAIIGIVTCTLSTIGILIGKYLGGIFQKCAGILGGAILIAIGIKILFDA